MRRFFLSIVMLVPFLFIQAQLLWKISGNGLEKPSYILGTHHLSAFSVMDSIEGLNEAFNFADQVYGEVIMSEITSPEFMMKMQMNLFMPEGITLKELYTEDEFNFINNYANLNLSMDLNTLISMKPNALQAIIAQYIHITYTGNHNPEEQLDLYFQNRALEEGKKIGGLENADDQIDMFYNSSPLERQAELLLCLINDIDEAIEKMRELNEAYLNQNINALLKLSEHKDGTSCDPLPEEMDNLNKNRNQKWAGIMPDIMKEGSTFFVVGALHLAGDDGTLNLLKQQGFQVEAVK